MAVEMPSSFFAVASPFFRFEPLFILPNRALERYFKKTELQRNAVKSLWRQNIRNFLTIRDSSTLL
ncbi:3281_t:CDS:2, partial [Ambispora leptoticha]